jgi:nucleotide-binding universal stress UspA family protein
MKKIIWAIDPFDTETRPDASALKELIAWKESPDVEIVPAYVLSFDSDEESEAHFPKHLQGARHASRHYVDSAGVGAADYPVVLVERSGSIQNAVDRLIRFAKNEKADVIAVATKGLSGLPRMIFGSFAESLLRRSDVPILFLSHHAGEKRANPSKALFSTDFSAYSESAFHRFVEHAAKCGLEIRLFHQATFPRQFESPVGPPALAFFPERYVEDQVSWARTQGARWKAFAQSQGVRVSLEISAEYGDTSGLILKAAAAWGAGLIAMASQSGPIASFLLGSVARGVFRPHGFPVWVCGPEFLKNNAIEEAPSETRIASAGPVGF